MKALLSVRRADQEELRHLIVAIARKRAGALTDAAAMNIALGCGEATSNCRKHGSDETAMIDIAMRTYRTLVVGITSASHLDLAGDFEDLLTGEPGSLMDESGRGFFLMRNLTLDRSMSPDGRLELVFDAQASAIVPYGAV